MLNLSIFKSFNNFKVKNSNICINTEKNLFSKINPIDIENKKEIFVKHYAYKSSLEILTQNKKIIISGIVGVGKTTLCEQLSLHIYNKLNNNMINNKNGYVKKLLKLDKSEKWGIYLFTCLKDFLKHYEYNQKNCIYFIDDIFGQIAWNIEIKEYELKKLLNILKQDQYNYFLISTRENIFKNINKFDLSLLENIKKFILEIDQLSTQDKADILYNHLKVYLKQENKNQALLSIIKNKNYWKIIEHRNYSPRIIETITMSSQNTKSLFKVFMGALNNPDKIWLNLFNELSEIQKCIVYIIYFLDNVLGVRKNFLDYIFKNIFCIEYKQDLYQLENSFIKVEYEGEYIKLYNPSIKDFLSNIIIDKEVLNKYIDIIIYWINLNLASTENNLFGDIKIFSLGVSDDILDRYQADIFKTLYKLDTIHISYLQCLNSFDNLKRLINEKNINDYGNNIIFHPYIKHEEKIILLKLLYDKFISTTEEIDFLFELD